MNINDLAAVSGYGALKGEGAAKPADVKQMAENFAAIFDRADAAVEGFATKNVDAQSMVEALSQAELALQTAITIRDKVVSAYQEVLRMPI